ncbi:hypothetical protein BDV95DRAFT_279394 [Massariosphaeria phaeospora]|uniref:Uncharacterized protein n=1 Tax=Massariosphaeria phaeospora TaxID=100035 RepID=A0A7C8MED8_9PLEO|nr:hypothetical protein BDV95DRAFT_279394 [Massariosphaeria phaeospora]
MRIQRKPQSIFDTTPRRELTHQCQRCLVKSGGQHPWSTPLTNLRRHHAYHTPPMSGCQLLHPRSVRHRLSACPSTKTSTGSHIFPARSSYVGRATPTPTACLLFGALPMALLSSPPPTFMPHSDTTPPIPGPRIPDPRTPRTSIFPHRTQTGPDATYPSPSQVPLGPQVPSNLPLLLTPQHLALPQPPSQAAASSLFPQGNFKHPSEHPH